MIGEVRTRPRPDLAPLPRSASATRTAPRISPSHLTPYTSIRSKLRSTYGSVHVPYVHSSPQNPIQNFRKLIKHPTGSHTKTIPEDKEQPIVVSSSMESCVLPIELCEKVMDAIPEYLEYPGLGSGWPTVPRKAWNSQKALCACALTCHAWRIRAQYLLWTFPSLIRSQQFLRFNTAIRKSLHTPTISGLVLGPLIADSHEVPDLSTAGELLMHSFPNLRSWVCFDISFERGPPLRVLRMRLPFFDSITFLQLWCCKFQSLRAMLDVVWACPNLAALSIGGNEIKSERCSAAGFQNLCTTNLRACRKLTKLWLHADFIKASPSFLSQIVRWLTIYYLHRNTGHLITLE